MAGLLVRAIPIVGALLYASVSNIGAEAAHDEEYKLDMDNSNERDENTKYARAQLESFRKRQEEASGGTHIRRDIYSEAVHAHEPGLPDRDYPEHGPENIGAGDPKLCQCIKPEQLPHKRSDTKDKDGEPEVLLDFFPKEFEGKLGKGGVFTRPHNFATFCGAHDVGTAPMCTEEKMKDPKVKAGCEKPWCFVTKECACGEAAKTKHGKMTLPHASRTAVEGGGVGPVYFSYQTCDPTEVSAAGAHKDEFCKDPANAKACAAMEGQCWKDAEEEDAKSGAASASAMIAVAIAVASAL